MKNNWFSSLLTKVIHTDHQNEVLAKKLPKRGMAEIAKSVRAFNIASAADIPELEMFPSIKLTDEQKYFISLALDGDNVLVDACIGSGKTTAIQYLCNLIPEEERVLYLTYNRLLKIDAQKKIVKANVHVQNYHGYAAEALRKEGIQAAKDDLLTEFNRRKLPLPQTDILIVDEYQDIDTECAELLEHIKGLFPDLQIIMVGDMEQKIYDNTSLDVKSFVQDFLEKYSETWFTTCFRLSADWANELGKTWHKKIVGVNKDCEILWMKECDVVPFLMKEEPKDILCLGPYANSSRNGYSKVLNDLETLAPEKFNKNTVYASIKDRDENIYPGQDCAIFTTYDSAKGLEKKICVLFDWTTEYWEARANAPGRSYHILRNIFCVAASRGKNKIIIVKADDQLPWSKIRTAFLPKKNKYLYSISNVFEHQRTEYVNQAYACLQCEKLAAEGRETVIDVPRTDALIDLSPCIGIYQEAMYFRGYDIDKQIAQVCKITGIVPEIEGSASLFEKILYLTSLETGQKRYCTQVNRSIVDQQLWEQIKERLSERLSKDEKVQVLCNIDVFGKDKQLMYSVVGLADAVKDGVVYELKFVSELSHVHFLQCALYMIALNLDKGILWNVRNNEVIEIRISDRKHLLTILTRMLMSEQQLTYKGRPLAGKEGEQKIIERRRELLQDRLKRQEMEREAHKKSEENHMQRRINMLQEMKQLGTTQLRTVDEMFAVVDVETTWSDVQSLEFGEKYKDAAFSIGVIIADAKTFQIVRALYYVLEPECSENGKFQMNINMVPEDMTCKCSREEAINGIKHILKEHRVEKVFAYSAGFDKRHLPELADYSWCDIINKAAYRDENNLLTDDKFEFYASGRLKRGYGAQDIYRLMSGDQCYCETHNALYDAIDELYIMEKLGYAPSEYPKMKA